MKILVLIWAALLMFSITASDPITESYTLLNSTYLAKPGCDSRCGDLIVPYPFGIGNNSKCYIDVGFRIYCDTSVNHPKATIKEGDYNSIKLISDSTVQLSNQLARKCISPNGTAYNNISIKLDIQETPYSFSKVNKFTAIGCDSYAWLASNATLGARFTGCIALCTKQLVVVANECTGIGCCQTFIPHDIDNYVAKVIALADECTGNGCCSYAFVGEENTFKFKGRYDLNDTNFKKRIEAAVPIVLEWAIGNRSCSEANATACQSNSICVNSKRKGGGYRCVCKKGYEGNPYLSPGCQDINECERKKDFPCYGTCINKPGNYTCKCKKGFSGDGKILNDCRPKPFNVLGLLIGTVFTSSRDS